MANICKPKGAKDDKQNLEFVRGFTVVHLLTPGKSENITNGRFEAQYEIVSEDKPTTT